MLHPSLDALAAGLEQSWPALETFDDGAQGWTKGDGTEYNTVTTCGAVGSLLGGYASPETQYSKTYNVGCVMARCCLFSLLATELACAHFKYF